MKRHVEKYIRELITHVSNLPVGKIEVLANKILEILLSNGVIYIVGNGGSAATASHFVCDLNKTVLGKDTTSSKKKRLKVICLSDNIPLLTAWANDVSYDYVFSEPLKNFINKNDLLIVITGSGNSKNIVNALKVAKEVGAYTFGILGFEGGLAKDIADDSIIVTTNHYGHIEDTHMILIHLITDYLQKLF